MAVIAAAYLTLIALTPRTDMMMMEEISWARLLPLCGLYLLLGISGFDYARRRQQRADLAGVPADRVRDRHGHQQAGVGRQPAADSAAAGGAGDRPAAARAGRRDVPARHRRRQRHPVVGAGLAELAAQHRPGDGGRGVRGRLRRRRRTRTRGAAARRSAGRRSGAARRRERAQPHGARDPRHAGALPDGDSRPARSRARGHRPRS